jgi:hypothetical protein
MTMTKQGRTQTPPKRGAHHDALDVFVGEWKAEGQSFGGPHQDARNPRGNPTRWTSTHEARWHTGKFFLIQNECAEVGGPFDTLNVLGWDASARRYFARTFENHGFYRHYEVTVLGKIWTISGETERARVEFSADGQRQTITWEWRQNNEWLPLCDRVATKL